MRIERSSAGKVLCDGACPLEFEYSTPHGCSHFAENSRNLSIAILSVVDDIIINSELPMVT